MSRTEELLSAEISSAPSPSHYMLANLALIRVRIRHVAPAMEDAKKASLLPFYAMCTLTYMHLKSLQVQPSPIGYIAMAVVLLGQGNREGALCEFDLAFHDCELHNNRLILLLKLILMFESGAQEEAISRIEHLVTRAKGDNDDEATYLYTQGCPWSYIPEDGTLWTSNTIDRAHREPRLKGYTMSSSRDDLTRRTAEAAEISLCIGRTITEKTQMSMETVDWFATLRFCKSLYEAEQSSSGGKLVGGCTAGCDEAVKADPSCPWGYEDQHVALHGIGQYDKAIAAFESMLRIIQESPDPAIRQRRNNYISPSDAMEAIDLVDREVLQRCPLVVIDVVTGCLCDRPEQMCIFKAGQILKQLVSSMTRELDHGRIQQVVEEFFGYVMFSHVWQGEEPSFQDVKSKSVWNLPDTPLNNKLRDFCREASKLGHNWAWSDTCCIDRSTSAILNQSLTSMYKWYAGSAVTLVYLAGVAHPSNLGDLTRSLWMTRGWTLQELLSPKVILFYDSAWKRYLCNISTNHKKTVAIMQELARSIKIPPETIISFSPDNLGVREKLRLASTRRVSVEEDVAYSLIGIFKSDIKPHYGDGADALGHLLEEIVARSGEVTVLAWSGRSSSYNTCLLASISVYSQSPHNPPPLQGEEMETCIMELCGRFSQQEALDIYGQINSLVPARFAARRLQLPCVFFSIIKLTMQGLGEGGEKLYLAKVSGRGQVFFRTTDDLLSVPQKYIFAHPWIRHIRGPSNGNVEFEAGLDEVAPPSSLPLPQVDDYTRALQLIARLEQPFNALLLAQQPDGEYKRVAANNEILVPGFGTDITPQNIKVEVLDIL
ncbi:hypothetical protein EDC04DRAFT_2604489 [Pisolithus marmoratus]|nr:hypothetical protein EDC04DRAFT_2604489 [Pisolithus marmoratus]